MKKRYNVAIIGCGGMGEAHIQENYYKENIRFTYACDCDLERAVMFQRKYGVDYITSDYKAVSYTHLALSFTAETRDRKVRRMFRWKKKYRAFFTMKITSVWYSSTQPVQENIAWISIIPPEP